jgi:hypothetical protein
MRLKKMSYLRSIFFQALLFCCFSFLALRSPHGQELSTQRPPETSEERPKISDESIELREQHYKPGQNLYGFHAGLGFPQIVGYGFDYFPESRKWGISLTLGGFRQEKSKSGSDPEYKIAHGSVHLSARYHPFHGVFYSGVHIGSQSTQVEATDSYLGQSVTATARVQGNYITPHAGFLWITKLGITVSTELGAQFNFNSRTSIDDGTTNSAVLNDSTYKKNKKDAEDQINSIFNGAFPHLTLLRVGYSF